MTRIKWKNNVELKVYQHDHLDTAYTESIKKNELDDVNIDTDDGKTVRMIFACGDVSFNVKKSSFQIMKK